MENKRNIITISGEIASGKGTICRLLSKRLNYSLFNVGDYMRELAKERNMSITDFCVFLNSHPEMDNYVEERTGKYAKEHDNLIMDSRMAWYVVPNSFKVYVKVDIDEAVKRVFYDVNRIETEKYDSLEECKKDTIARYNNETERYFKLYGVKRDDLNNYDFVIDTTNLTPEEAVDRIEKAYKEWQNK